MSSSGQAARLRRPSWRDPRLIVGVLLVLVSVLLCTRLVAAADDTRPVWVARSTLAPGQALSRGNVAVVWVHLAGVSSAYFDAARPFPEGVLLLRTVGSGELVPRSAVAPASVLARRPVTIPVDGVVPAGLRPGASVDVWVSRRDRTAGTGAYTPPARIAVAAPVQSVDSASGALSAVRATGVAVLLDDAELPQVLDALANDARLALVPVPGSAAAWGG